MTIEELWAAFLHEDRVCDYMGSFATSTINIVRAAILQAHVDACREEGWRRRRCGDDWYCRLARKIQQLEG